MVQYVFSFIWIPLNVVFTCYERFKCVERSRAIKLLVNSDIMTYCNVFVNAVLLLKEVAQQMKII